MDKKIVDKKYLTYSAEDFSQDLRFINWIIKGIDQREWEMFVLENPELSKEISTARKIVSALRFREKDLKDEIAYDLYKDIESFHRQHHQSKPILRFRKMMQYAAFFVLVLSVGAAIPYLFFNKQSVKFTDIPLSSTGYNDAKLILSGGEEILLKGKQNDLQFNAAGNQIRIDKDSVINYNKTSAADAMAQVVVPYGKRSNILLSDGTKVWLNAGSTLVFPQKFSGKNRQVFLKGEAYFEVFKNKKIPFIVNANEMNVTVQGTEFNIRNFDSDNELEVVLVEGAVSLKENRGLNLLGKEFKIIPNQKAVFNKSENKTTVESNVNVAFYISWKEGLLVFEKESIDNVFKKLSRYYNVSFVTDSGVALNSKFSGKLDLKESLEVVMKVVSDAAPVFFQIGQDKVFVTSKINDLPMR